MRALGPQSLVAALLFLATVTHAAWGASGPALPDPDTEVARRHYDKGIALYDQQRYADAAREFEAARRIKPLPAFDFNIGRCDERLEKWAEAADAFERYLAASPNASDVADVRGRIAVLRERAGGVQAKPGDAPSEATPLVKRWWFWTAIGAVVVAGVVVGVAVGTSGETHAPVPASSDGNFTVRF